MLGCGQIADAHLQEIRKISGAEVVAVCDRYIDLAEQAARRFNVPAVYTDLDLMLQEVKPDVVHLATPAQSHAKLAIKILEAGCHVYVEKPFTLNVDEALEVIETAQRVNKKVCVGHDQIFDPMWMLAKQRIQRGEIGEVKHVESTLVYPLNGNFGSQVISDQQHWVRQLPGGLFHNTISHPLYRITDFLLDEQPVIHAHWFSIRPEITFPTELRAFFIGKDVTGTLTFLTSVKQAQRVTKIYGTKGHFVIDFDSQIISRHLKPRMPGAFQKLDDSFRMLLDAFGNFRRNIWRFMRSEIHYFSGMNELFTQFYASIRDDSLAPISNEEILRVTSIMDRVFEQCHDSPIDARVIHSLEQQTQSVELVQA